MSASLKVGITSDEATAIVQADSTDRGMLIPRMTEAQRDAISTPATGLLVYNTDDDTFDYYDGSSWQSLNPVSAGTGEIFLTAAGGWPSTTNGCAEPAKTEYTTNDQDLYSLDFDQSTQEYAQWTVWMPDNWDAGTVTFETVWTAASGSGDVVWALQGRSYANDDAIDQSWGTEQTSTDTLLATGDIHYSPESSAITLAGTPVAGELVQFRLFRDADAGSDTLSGDAKLLGVKVYYTKS